MTADTLTHSGTRISNAIQTATERLISDQDDSAAIDSDPGGQTVLILFTDGEDHDVETISAAKEASRIGVYVYCVGVGNSVQPVPIPLPQGTGTGTETTPYKRDANGQLVLTVLDETHLQEIAKAGQGNYYSATAGISQLRTDLTQLERQKFRIRRDGEYQERFQLFVAAALILLICGRLHFAAWSRKWRS